MQSSIPWLQWQTVILRLQLQVLPLIQALKLQQMPQLVPFLRSVPRPQLLPIPWLQPVLLQLKLL